MTPAGKMAPTGLFLSELRLDQVQWLQTLALCPMSSSLDTMTGPDFICPLTSLPIQMQQGIGPQIQAPCSIQNLSRFGSLQRFGILLQPKLGPLLSHPHQLVIQCLLHTMKMALPTFPSWLFSCQKVPTVRRLASWDFLFLALVVPLKGHPQNQLFCFLHGSPLDYEEGRPF